MSAGLLFTCDVAVEYGLCPGQLATRAMDLAAAQAVLDRAGWTYRAGKYRCATCSKLGRS